MAGYDEFQAFKNYQIMDNESIDLASNYACFQLNNLDCLTVIIMTCTPILQNVKLFYKLLKQRSLVRTFAAGSWLIF